MIKVPSGVSLYLGIHRGPIKMISYRKAKNCYIHTPSSNSSSMTRWFINSCCWFFLTINNNISVIISTREYQCILQQAFTLTL